jgi:hypothetical protein
VDRERSVTYSFYDEGRRFGMSVDLPAADGAVVVRAIDRRAKKLPVMPGQDGPWGIEARRADALVAMCSGHIAQDPDPDRATVVLHARVGGAFPGGNDGLAGGDL